MDDSTTTTETTDNTAWVSDVAAGDEVKMLGESGGPTTFAELDALQEAQEAAAEASELTHKFQMLASNIVHSPEVEDKAGALAALATEFAERLEGAMKEANRDKAVWSTAKVNDLPDSSFLYILDGGEKDKEGKTKPRSLRMFPYKDADGKVDLPHLRNAIARIPQSNRIDAATKNRLQTKARRILKEQQGKEKKGLVERVKDFFSKEKAARPELPNSFMVWKEADAWRWFAVYSNNYRDSDNPPEIISAAAHREFVASVDKEEWDYPELWMWHVPGSRSGQADWLAYDEDTGFAMAAGKFDPGKEHVAKGLSKWDEQLLTSHGMPSKELRYDEEDKTIITRYRSREISPLPAGAAANKWNPPFNVLTEVKSMAIPDHKREFLEELGLDPAAIEAQLAERKEQLDEAGVESKETDEQGAEVKAEVAVEDAEAVVDETETEPEPAAGPTLEQLADTIGTAINEAIAPLAQRIEALEGKEAERVVEAEEKQAEPETPLVALGQLLKSRVIGADEARVDGRTKEAHDGPKETESELPSPLRSGNPLADTTVARLLAGRTWQELGRLEN